MKQVWSSPKTSFEQFVPQNYIAACGDSGTVYKFTCDAGGGTSGSVYLETNGQEGLQKSGASRDSYLSTYHACNKYHEAESTDGFLDGYFVYEEWSWDSWSNEEKIMPVIVWRGENNDNTHCTAELDMNKWETAKS